MLQGIQAHGGAPFGILRIEQGDAGTAHGGFLGPNNGIALSTRPTLHPDDTPNDPGFRPFFKLFPMGLPLAAITRHHHHLTRKLLN